MNKKFIYKRENSIWLSYCMLYFICWYRNVDEISLIKFMGNDVIEAVCKNAVDDIHGCLEQVGLI
jgi:predicted metal-binding protein